MILSQLPRLRYTIAHKFYISNKRQIVVVEHVDLPLLEVDWGEVKLDPGFLKYLSKRRETESSRK